MTNEAILNGPQKLGTTRRRTCEDCGLPFRLEPRDRRPRYCPTHRLARRRGGGRPMCHRALLSYESGFFVYCRLPDGHKGECEA